MDTYDGRHERDSGDPVFFEVLTGVARKSSSGFRSNRLMEDVNSMASYLRDIRICLIALTLLIYGLLIFYIARKCINRRKKTQNGTRRSQWDFQTEQKPILEPRNQGIQLEELVCVRSDAQIGNSNLNASIPSYANRNHRASTPTMRHTRIGHELGNGGKLSEHVKSDEFDSSFLRHTIPHIITSDMPSSPKDTSISPNEDTVESTTSFKSSLRQQIPKDSTEL